MLARIVCAAAMVALLCGCKPIPADARLTYEQAAVCLTQDVTGAITAISSNGCIGGISTTAVVYCAQLDAGSVTALTFGPCSPFAPIALPRSAVTQQIPTSICFYTDAITFAVVSLHLGNCP